MENLSLVSSTQILTDVNNNRKQIYNFATMFVHRSQQQAPCVTLYFIITNILLLLHKIYETRVLLRLISVKVKPHIRTFNSQTTGSESRTAQYKLAASVGSTLNGTVSTHTHIYIYIFI